MLGHENDQKTEEKKPKYMLFPLYFSLPVCSINEKYDTARKIYLNIHSTSMDHIDSRFLNPPCILSNPREYKWSNCSYD